MRVTLKGMPIVAVVCLAVSVLGCGAAADPMATVKGKITKGGEPLQVDKAQYGDYAAVTASLQHMEEGSDRVKGVYSVAVGDDGTFTAEVPPGKYRIAVSQMEGPQNDLLGGEFSIENTPIEREISGGSQELTIDLDNP